MNSLLLESVHLSLAAGGIGAPRYIVLSGTGNSVLYPRPIRRRPMKASPLRAQISEAARDPKEFERAMERALIINLHFLRQGPFRMTLCPSVENPDICLDGRFCRHAGSLAELYANNIHLNPGYKTKPCRYRDKCQTKAECSYGHPGDLMRRVEKTARGLTRIRWHVLES